MDADSLSIISVFVGGVGGGGGGGVLFLFLGVSFCLQSS